MVLVAIVLVIIAWGIRNSEEFLWLAFKISGITYSGLLGVFLVGLLSKRGKDKWNLIAMIIGSASTALLLIISEKGIIQLAWQYPMLIGVGLTYLIGIIPTASEPPVKSEGF